MKVIGYLGIQNFLGFAGDSEFQCKQNNKIFFQDSSILKLLGEPLIRIIGKLNKENKNYFKLYD